MIRRPPSLRRRIAMVVVAAAIMGAGLAWWLAAGIARSQMVEAQQRNRALVEVVAGKVGLYLRHPTENLATVANGLEQGTIPQADILYELEHLRQYTRVFSQLMFLDAAGAVVAASPAGSYPGLDLSRHPAFLAARTAAGLQWGEISRSIDTGAPVVTISLRCPSGVLIGTFDLGRLGDIPTSIDQGAGGFVAILDRNGASIAHSDPDVALQGWSFASLKPAAKGQAMGEPARWQGRDGIAIAVPVPDSGWSVVTFQSSEAVFAKARQLRWTMTVAIAGTVLVMAWLVYLLAVRLLRPLGSLVQAAGSLAAGGSAAVPTPYEELTGAVAALNDLAAGVRRREEDIRRSRQEFADLVENVDSIILRMTPDGRIAFMNTCAERVFGYSRSEAIGRPMVGLIVPAHDSQGNDLCGLVDRYVADRAAFSVHENENITKDGDLIWVSWRNRVSRDAQGQLTGIFSVGHDITERKRAEEEKEKLQAQLTQAQKMESVGRLAGGVAHDFNNMLGVILGHAEMALLKIGPNEPLHVNLEEIKKAAERSAALTRQLLAFARKQTVSPKVIDLNKTVAGMLKMLHRLIGEDIDLLWQPGANLKPVKVDPSQIDQLLANLCVNARDAIDGAGKITIETDAKTFDEAYCADHPGALPGEYVLLDVSDDGCGMDQDLLNHIFEPFFTTKEQGKGTGLGLASVFGVVKQNNGFINVYSEPGQGTTFKIYLPAYAEKATGDVAKVPELPTAYGHETVLLVEDELAILEMTTKMLRSLGYTVVDAASSAEAIRLAQEHRGLIDLLMTDVVMPGVNGRELAANLLSNYPNLKILFMSGYTANVIAHHGVLDEGVHFIQKPFSMKDLGAKLREVLES